MKSQVLGHPNLIDRSADRAFLLSSQSPMGGFGKEPDDYPDPYHSYLALAALALSYSGEEGLGLSLIDARWNVSAETASWMGQEVVRVKQR